LVYVFLYTFARFVITNAIFWIVITDTIVIFAIVAAIVIDRTTCDE
jgi:hypothetical protein